MARRINELLFLMLLIVWGSYGSASRKLLTDSPQVEEGESSSPKTITFFMHHVTEGPNPTTKPGVGVGVGGFPIGLQGSGNAIPSLPTQIGNNINFHGNGNGNDPLPLTIPSGAIKNSPLFGQLPISSTTGLGLGLIPNGGVQGTGLSYAEMEKHFKIFVYPEGEPPLVHWGPCRSIYSTECRFIQQLEIPGSPFVTSHPEEAQAFFLPFSVAMMVKFIYKHETYEMPKVRLFVKDYIDGVTRKYPYWNRSLGADHFMLSFHDWGPITSLANPFLYNNSIRVLCNANSSEGFNPMKDAALPEMNLITDHYSSHRMFGGRPPLERPTLAFFAGANHGVVRPLLFKHWTGHDPDIQVHQYLPKGKKHTTYLEYMNKSKFCLCPSGYEVASPRIVEAIYSGCVPVIISDHYVLPFSDVLNWDTFSVFVPPPQIPYLKNILQSIPMETYVKLHVKVKEVQKHFHINHPPRKYDMFHMIFHSVWLRRLNIIIQK